LFPEKKYKLTGGIIGKDKRFAEAENAFQYSSDVDYNPNYDAVLKRTTNVLIKRDLVKEELLSKRKAKRIEEMTLESGKLNLSVNTADTEADYIGPGAYEPKYTMVEAVKNVPIAKARRFEPSKKDQLTKLDVKYDQVKYSIR